jgi:hypothetical protein
MNVCVRKVHRQLLENCSVVKLETTGTGSLNNVISLDDLFMDEVRYTAYIYFL